MNSCFSSRPILKKNKEIKSKDNSLLKYVKKLENNKFSREEKMFIVEGRHLVEMAKKHIKILFCLCTIF